MEGFSGLASLFCVFFCFFPWWCNGSTTAFDAASHGSNPCPGAKLKTPCRLGGFLIWLSVLPSDQLPWFASTSLSCVASETFPSMPAIPLRSGCRGCGVVGHAVANTVRAARHSASSLTQASASVTGRQPHTLGTPPSRPFSRIFKLGEGRLDVRKDAYEIRTYSSTS